MEDDEDASSKLFLESSRFWIQRVFVPILVCIGVGGNVVTVKILTRKRMRCTTHIYLTALAVADLIYLLFVLLLSFEHYPNIHNRKYELYWRFYGITHWLCDAASSTSVWLTVSFTIERYIIVCHPLRGKVYCTEGRAKNIITIISLLCLITTASTTFEHQLALKEHCMQEHCDNKTLNVDKHGETTPTAVTKNNNDEIPIQPPECVKYAAVKDEVETTEDPCAVNPDACFNNHTCCVKSYTIYTEFTELGKNLTYTVIINWFSSVTFGLLPIVLIATFNCFLIKAVYKSTRMRKLMTNSLESTKQRHENRITILLIGIVVLFLVCQTPTATFLIYEVLDEDSETSTLHTLQIKRALGNIFNFLLTLNASCNFLMYCVLSANYRQTFRTVFCARKLNRQDTAAFSSRASTRYAPQNGFRRNNSEYQTPRNIETQSLNSIPRSKSLMTRPIGKAKSTDLNV